MGKVLSSQDPEKVKEYRAAPAHTYMNAATFVTAMSTEFEGKQTEEEMVDDGGPLVSCINANITCTDCKDLVDT